MSPNAIQFHFRPCMKTVTNLIELPGNNDSGLIAKRQTGSYINNSEFSTSAFPLVQNLLRLRVSRKALLGPIEILICPVQKFNKVVGSIDLIAYVCFGFRTVQVFHYAQVVRLEIKPRAIEKRYNDSRDY